MYYYGNREIGIHHARLRMGCSLLNGHLSKILHVIDDPGCRCGFHIESPSHFFLNCPLYAGQRIILIQKITEVSVCNINIIFFGNKNFNLIENEFIFQAVHE